MKYSKIPGASIVWFSYVTTGIFSLLLAGFLSLPEDYAINLTSFLLLTVGHIFVFSGLLIGHRLMTNVSTQKSQIPLTTSRRYYFLAILVYALLIPQIDLHVLGNPISNNNPRFIEGITEIISRYLLPAFVYQYIISNAENVEPTITRIKKNIFRLVLIISIVWTIYIDVAIKGSKHIVFTYILILLLANSKARFMKPLHWIGTFILVVIVFGYITLTRLSPQDPFSVDKFSLVSDPLVFLAQTIYIRLVGISELSSLLKYDLPWITFNIPVGHEYALANLYTQSVHGIPIGGTHTSAPGFLGFFLFAFGYSGLLGCIPFGLLISLLYRISMSHENRLRGEAITSLLFSYLLIDGGLDERMFSLFLVKLYLLYFVISFLSEKRLVKKYFY